MKDYRLLSATLFLVLTGCPSTPQSQLTSSQSTNTTTPSVASPMTDLSNADSTTSDPVENAATEPTAPTGTDPLYWSQIVKLYQQAVETGQTTAGSASQWTSDVWKQTSDTSSQLAGSTKDWIVQSFESAKNAGVTSATSSKDFFNLEMAKIGTWEYHVLEVGPSIAQEKAKQLNELGQKRWECIAVNSLSDDRSQFVFKRKVKSQFDNIPTKDLARIILMVAGGGLLGGDSKE